MTAKDRHAVAILADPVIIPGRTAQHAAVLSRLQRSRRVRQALVQTGEFPPAQIPALVALRPLGMNGGHLGKGGPFLELRQNVLRQLLGLGHLTRLPGHFSTIIRSLTSSCTLNSSRCAR